MQNLLKSLKEYAHSNHVPVMLGEVQSLLEKTIEENLPKHILEIGTAIGFSGIIMLLKSPQAVLNTVEMNESSIRTAKENFKKANFLNRVNFFWGDAREIVPKLSGRYDFIFLDGPKGQYDVFLPYLLKLLNVGGILFADNVFYKGLVENMPHNRHKHITIAKNLNKFLENLKADESLQTCFYHIGDGVSISKKIKE